MNQWSEGRKRTILSIIILALIVLVGVPVFFIFYRAPTCFDSIQNGDETGVDCGGSCQLLCTAESLPLLTKGDPQIVKVRSNTFELVTLVENPNINAEIYRAGYVFKVYDATNLAPLRVIEGETYVPKGATFVVFEGPFTLGVGVVPTRVTFEWKDVSLTWQKNDGEVPELVARDMHPVRKDTTPQLRPNIENLSLETVSNIDLVTLIFDETGSIFAASKTFIEMLSPGAITPVVFTWPEPIKIETDDICGFPVDVALVIDRSGSMDDLGDNPPQPITDVKETALYFVSQLGKNDRYSLVSFASEASQPVDAQLGVNLVTIQSIINNISIAPVGTQDTNIGAGILAASEELVSMRHRDGADKALVLLTDGVPTQPNKSGVNDYPKTYALESAERARLEGISIYTIGLGKNVNAELLRAIATTTAEAYFAPSTKELGSIYKQIATKICKKNLTKTDIYIRILPDKSFLR